MHLADRRRRGCVVVEILEELLDRLAVPLLLEYGLDLLPLHRRRLGAQRRELVLIQLAVLLGDELRVDERRELADLHRRALHRAEHVDHPLGGLEVARVHGLVRLLLRAGEIGGARACVARAL
jgi:hypothetical protein